MPVSLVFAAQPGAPARGRLRLTALGATLLELDGDETELQFAMTDAASRRTAPTRFESPERLALRRAVNAVAHDEQPDGSRRPRARCRPCRRGGFRERGSVI